MKIAFQCCSRWGQLFCEGLDSVRTLLGRYGPPKQAGFPLQLFSLMWSSPDIVGLFSINVVSFSRNVVLRGLLFSPNLV